VMEVTLPAPLALPFPSEAMEPVRLTRLTDRVDKAVRLPSARTAQTQPD
jgi:hypothetical protein